MLDPMRRTLIAAALAATLTTSLAACSVVDNVVEGAVSEGVEQLSGGVEGLVSDALGGAELTTDGSLPESFPAEVPLVPGTVLGGGAGPNESGWAARIELTSATEFTAAQKLLEDAGFSGSGISSDPSSGFGTFTSSAYTVTLTVTTTDGVAVATYVVTPR
jgi:hypothetical protein